MRTAVLALVLAAGCTTNPHTGRDQFILLSEEEELQLGAQSYQEVLSKENLSTSPAEVDPVRRVGQRIAAAAGKPEYRWEFSVIVDDRTVNAWCMPGGKIAFYTGIFPALADEAGMAFVMGHEVSHALARHGAERISENMVVGGLGGLLAATLGGRDEKSQELVLAAYGVVTGVGIVLPHSRAHESEADALGLNLMARAGYDPRQAVEVWKRMAALGGGGTPEFLSTHPSDETRIRDLEARMPEALAFYERSARAPTSALPAIPGNRKGAGGKGGAALVAAAGSVSARGTGHRRARQRDGTPELQLGFQFSRDVYVERVDVTGPGLVTGFDAKAGVPGGSRRVIALSRTTGDFPAGQYTVVFGGAASGERFTATVLYTVP